LIIPIDLKNLSLTREGGPPVGFFILNMVNWKEKEKEKKGRNFVKY
jgi:hypothetical protein